MAIDQTFPIVLFRLTADPGSDDWSLEQFGDWGELSEELQDNRGLAFHKASMMQKQGIEEEPLSTTISVEQVADLVIKFGRPEAAIDSLRAACQREYPLWLFAIERPDRAYNLAMAVAPAMPLSLFREVYWQQEEKEGSL